MYILYITIILYIIYYYILYYYYYYILYYTIISYYILYYTLLSFCSHLPLFSSSLLSFSSFLSQYSLPLLQIYSSFPLSNTLLSSFQSIFYPLFSSFPSSSSDLSSFLPHSCPSWSICQFKVYVSAFGYPYLYSRLIQLLTPHVLSDGNVEWCSFNVCGVLFWAYVSGSRLRCWVLGSGVRVYVLSWCWR